MNLVSCLASGSDNRWFSLCVIQSCAIDVEFGYDVKDRLGRYGCKLIVCVWMGLGVQLVKCDS